MNTSRTMAVCAVFVIALQVLGNAALGETAGRVDTGVRFSELMFNPMGTEQDGEWVEICNYGSTSVNLGGWTLTDQDAAPELVFPDIELTSGQFVVVHTGAGENGTDASGTVHFYIGRTSGVWNNPGDDSLLLDSDSNVADFFSYGNGTGLDACPAEGYWPHAAQLPAEGLSLALAGEPMNAWLPRVPSEGRANGAPLCTDVVLITGVCYAPLDSGEYAELTNVGDSSFDLSDWQLTDFDGTLAFPEGAAIQPGNELVIAENATKYIVAFGSWPDFSYGNMTCVDKGFGLANAGEEIALIDPWGVPADIYVFGSSEYAGVGWTGAPATVLGNGKVSTRFSEGGLFADTNTSSDWDVGREVEPGQTAAVSGTFSTSNLTVMAFPDAGRGRVLSLMDEAENEILVNMYELTVSEAAARLVSAAERGVRVSVLLEGEPVGGFTSVSAELCDLMCNAGIDVRLMTSRSGARESYRFDHAKYMVVDGRTLYLSTENWSPNGLPADGCAGNRGWAAVVREGSLASFYAGVFRADWENFTTPWAEIAGEMDVVEPDAVFEAKPFERLFAPVNATGVSVIRPVLSPDTSMSNGTIIGMIRAAKKEICAEQMSVYKDWDHYAGGIKISEPNPYLEELLGAARRGVGVRVLMDSTSYDGEPCDNVAAVQYLNTMAALEGLNLSAKLVAPGPHGFVKIHAKGMVVDSETALVSSINWGRNSVVENREAGLIIESASAGEYFRAVFDYDWRDDVMPPVAEIDVPSEALVNYSVEISANGSWDDMGIAGYEWLIDGRLVLSDEYALYWMFTTPGNHTVRLTVADAWGNENSTERVVSVEWGESCVCPEQPPEGDGMQEDGSAAQTATGDSSGTGGMGIGALAFLSIPGIALVAGWGLSSRLSKGKRGKSGKQAVLEQADGAVE
ncbi:MAG: phospholipase D-like domain-containing protein [Methanobacteriota archaeon]